MRLVIILLLIASRVFGQNLVPDPSFEDRTSVDSCFSIIDTGITSANILSFYNQPKILNHWSSPTFATSGTVHVRCNPRTAYGGTQDPLHDSTMALFRVYNFASNNFGTFAESRSYLQTRLIDTLKANTSYRVSFYVSFTTIPRNLNYNYYASSSIGAYFSKDRITDFKRPFQADSTVLNYQPQIKNHPDSFFSDTAQWNLICGIMKAKGGEVWLTIGNFEYDLNTNLKLARAGQTSNLSADYSGYFVDLVSVEEVNNIEPSSLEKDTSVCPNSTFGKVLRARPGALSYHWSDGSSDSILLIDSIGTYWLNADYGCGIESDTFKVYSIPVKSLDLGNDIEVCAAQVDSVLIVAPKGFNSYLWNNGISSDSIWVKTSTELTLAATYPCGTLRDTIKVVFKPFVPKPIVLDTSSCTGVNFTPQVIGQDLLWYDSITDTQPRTTPPILNEATEGVRNIFVSQRIDGCESEITIAKVHFYDSVRFSLSIDTPLCDLDSIQLWSANKLLNNLWSTSETADTISISNSGLYWLESSNGCNSYRDSVLVDFRLKPNQPDVMDSNYCNKITWRVEDLPIQGNQLLWFLDSLGNGESQSAYLPADNWQGYSRLFVSTVENGCRSDISSFSVLNTLSPIVSLNESYTFCNDEAIVVFTDPIEGMYSWSNGHKGKVFRSDTSGVFQLKVENSCGEDSATFKVIRVDCSTKIYFPNVFSPNNDGINDTFFPNGQNFQAIQLHVYNRWGERIYDDPSPWDGQKSGNDVPKGNYFYHFLYEDANGEVQSYQGKITLLR